MAKLRGVWEVIGLTFGIAVVVGITMIAGSVSEARSRKACASNLKDLAQGIHLYATDNDGYEPVHFPIVNYAISYTAPPHSSYYWKTSLLPYVRESAFTCPAQPTVPDSMLPSVANLSNYEHYKDSEVQGALNGGRLYLKIDDLKSPATTRLVGDISDSMGGYRKNHKAGSNVVYYDGHLVFEK